MKFFFNSKKILKSLKKKLNNIEIISFRLTIINIINCITL